MRRPSNKKIIYIGVFTVIIFFIFLHPVKKRFRNYAHIVKEDILQNLHEEIVENFTSSAAIDCNYDSIINDPTTLSPSLVDDDLIEGHGIREGGEYIPQDCKPKYSTAIIVPYRDRAEQLRGFLVYMHMFFRHQHIHYRIYIVEQVDSHLFNRAKLMNIGAVAAMKAGFPCLILHDVDLLPLKPANLYACTELPRHMSSSIDQFRFILPYLELYGGAVAITAKQFKSVNGMSNEYYGWGGEDDDLYSRLDAKNLRICRFDPEISKYHTFKHDSVKKGERKKKLLSFAKKSMTEDGLSSLRYIEVATVLHPLFTHIMVDL